MTDKQSDSTESNTRYGRRQLDMEHAQLATRLDEAEKELSSNKGRFSSMLWFMGILGGIIGASLMVLISKTSAIESLLTDNKVSLAQHAEQILTLRTSVKDTQERMAEIERELAVTKERIK